MTHTLVANRLGAAVVGLWSAATADDEALHPRSVAALLTLRHWAPVSISALAAVIGLGHSGAVRLVDSLEAQGLVRRSDGADRRTRLLELTSTGTDVAVRLESERALRLGRALAPLDDDEVAQLGGLLGKVLDGLPGSTEEARMICRFCDHAICDGPQCPIGEAARRIDGEGSS